MAPRDHFRTHGRVPVQITALLRPNDAKEVPVKIRDLGFGGAGVEVVDVVDVVDSTPQSSEDPTASPVDLSAGTSVILEVVAPVLWDPLYLPGRVAWRSSHMVTDQPIRAGICFDQLGATTLLSLFDVLSAD